MSKSAIKGEFSFCQRRNAARKKAPRERRGRGLYEGVFALSNPKKQFFYRLVDGMAPHKNRSPRGQFL